MVAASSTASSRAVLAGAPPRVGSAAVRVSLVPAVVHPTTAETISVTASTAEAAQPAAAQSVVTLR